MASNVFCVPSSCVREICENICSKKGNQVLTKQQYRYETVLPIVYKRVTASGVPLIPVRPVPVSPAATYSHYSCISKAQPLHRDLSTYLPKKYLVSNFSTSDQHPSARKGSLTCNSIGVKQKEFLGNASIDSEISPKLAQNDTKSQYMPGFEKGIVRNVLDNDGQTAQQNRGELALTGNVVKSVQSNDSSTKNKASQTAESTFLIVDQVLNSIQKLTGKPIEAQKLSCVLAEALASFAELHLEKQKIKSEITPNVYSEAQCTPTIYVEEKEHFDFRSELESQSEFGRGNEVSKWTDKDFKETGSLKKNADAFKNPKLKLSDQYNVAATVPQMSMTISLVPENNSFHVSLELPKNQNYIDPIPLLDRSISHQKYNVKKCPNNPNLISHPTEIDLYLPWNVEQDVEILTEGS